MTGMTKTLTLGAYGAGEDKERHVTAISVTTACEFQGGIVRDIKVAADRWLDASADTLAFRRRASLRFMSTVVELNLVASHDAKRIERIVRVGWGEVLHPCDQTRQRVMREISAMTRSVMGAMTA